VLLLDTSGSMRGPRLAALNQALEEFADDLRRDAVASRRIEIAVVTFGSEVSVVQRFVTAERFRAPVLTASGQTAMGAGIEQALTLIDARKKAYRRHGLPYYRPWVLMITDGKPEGEPDSTVARAAERLRAEEAAKRVALFAVGVEGADLGRLRTLVVRQPLPLRGLRFDELFVWLSASMQAMSTSQPGVRIALPPMTWLKRISTTLKNNEEVIRDSVAIARIVVRATLGA